MVWSDPFDKVWSDDQCETLERIATTSKEKCANKCNANSRCTAINFNQLGYSNDPNSCILKACPTMVPPPTGNLPEKGYRGYHLSVCQRSLGN